MDKERARFVLGCFRPDGADASNPDFAEALRLAAEDRDLGEWLARERARDAAFSSALVQVEVPAGLREEIMTGFAFERGEMPRPEVDETDAAFIGALASLRAPEGLHSQILAAMERSTAKYKVIPAFWKFGVPLAAAAAVALGVFLNQNATTAERGQPLALAENAAAPETLPVETVETKFLRMLSDSSFHLDMSKANHQSLFAYLKEHSLPCPCPKSMPPGLAKVEGVGCRMLEIDGHRGSLVCFDEREGKKVHLLVFFRKEIDGDLPGVKHPNMRKDGEWAVATWEFKDRVFLLLGKTDTRQLAKLF